MKTFSLILLIPFYWGLSMSCTNTGGGGLLAPGNPPPGPQIPGGGIGDQGGLPPGGGSGDNAQPSWQQTDTHQRPDLLFFKGQICYRPELNADCKTVFSSSVQSTSWQKTGTEETPGAWAVAEKSNDIVHQDNGEFQYHYSRRLVPTAPSVLSLKFSFFYIDQSGCYSGETSELELSNTTMHSYTLSAPLELKPTDSPQCLKGQVLKEAGSLMNELKMDQ